MYLFSQIPTCLDNLLSFYLKMNRFSSFCIMGLEQIPFENQCGHSAQAEVELVGI